MHLALMFRCQLPVASCQLSAASRRIELPSIRLPLFSSFLFFSFFYEIVYRFTACWPAATASSTSLLVMTQHDP
jgi:hypothetical protein